MALLFWHATDFWAKDLSEACTRTGLVAVADMPLVKCRPPLSDGGRHDLEFPLGTSGQVAWFANRATTSRPGARATTMPSFGADCFT